MMQVTFNGELCSMPGNMDVGMFATDPELREPQDVQLDPVFLERMRLSALISKMAYADKDQSVANMARWDRLRAMTGVY